jgi:multidrug efflux pump subunit AcrB
MIPLVQDPFFSAMTISIMFGLSFAAVVALIVVPVLYAIFIRAGEEAKSPAGVR